MTETIVAVGLSAIVILAATRGMMTMSANSKTLLTKSTSDSNTQSTAEQGITSHFESAYVATQYQHLPINVDCSGNPFQYPCVRQLDSSGNFQTPSSSLDLVGTFPYIEFFRDHDPGQTSPATGLYKPIKAGAKNAVVQTSSQISLSANTRAGSYFTTWPLLGPPTSTDPTETTSPPFVMMRSYPKPPIFKFDKDFVTTAHPNDYSFFKVNRQLEQTEMNGLKGSLLLIYNAYSPNQYTIQWVRDIIECWPSTQTDSSQPSPCDSMADYAMNPPAATDPTGHTNTLNYHHYIWYSAVTYSKTDYEYALDLQALPAGAANPSTRFAAKYQPDPSSFGVAFGATWGTTAFHQDPSLYAFPSIVDSLVEVGNTTDFPTIGANKAFDIRRIQHFYDQATPVWGNAAAYMVAVPVFMTSYYLKTNVAATQAAVAAAKFAGQTTNLPRVYSLVASTWNQTRDNPPGTRPTWSGDPEISIIDQVTGKVIFAREIGSTAMSLYLYDQVNALTKIETRDIFDRLPFPLEGVGSSFADANPAHGEGGIGYE